MDELFYLLIFLFFFVVMPMLQRMRRRQRPQPSPRQQGPGGRDAAPGTSGAGSRSEYGTTTARRPTPQRTEPQTAAEDVIPDDLWEILTGEKRRPRPGPEPEHADDVSEYEEVEASYEESEPEYEPAYGSDRKREREENWLERDDVSAETSPSRWEPEPIPAPVPLPRSVPLPSRVHAPRLDIRRQLTAADQLRIAREIEALQERPQKAVSLNLDNRKELRRAIILREVLGPPKGLQ